MRGDVLRGFERALVLQVGGAARPPLDHAVGVLLPQGLGRWREQRRGVKLSARGDEDVGGRGEQCIFGDYGV